MFTLKHVPFVWITLSYVSGIFIADRLMLNTELQIIWLAFSLLLILCFIFRRNALLFVVFVCSFLMLTGAYKYFSYHEFVKKDHFKYLPKRPVLLIGTVKKRTQKTNFLSTELKITHFLEHGHKYRTTGSLLAYLKIDKNNIRKINIESVVKIRTVPQPIKRNSNPETFDYRRYMHTKNIHYQAFVESSDWQVLDHNSYRSISAYFRKINKSVVELLKSELHEKEVAAVVTAISLGDKSSLTEEVLNSFSNTGARHILTVSGMHVGIIVLITLFITSFISSKRKSVNYIKLLFILLTVWSYTFLVGAQAAVLRAAFMLSVLLIGKEFSRYINTINFLFFSAFILLLINPFQLFQLSFLLSYTALLSILLFYKPVIRLWNPKNRFVHYIWQLTCISISAQILILPLSVYYFHKAPLLFMLTGIIATPAAFLIMSLVIIFIIFHYTINLPESFVLNILEFITSAFLKAIGFIDDLPFGTFNDIWIDSFTLLLCYLLISVLSLLYSSKKKLFLYASLTTMLVLSSYISYRQYLIKNLYQICVYASKKKSIIDIFVGDKCYTMWCNEDATGNGDFVFKNLRSRNQTREIIKIDKLDDYDEDTFKKKNNVLLLKKLNVVIISDGKSVLPDADRIELLIIDKLGSFELGKVTPEYIINRIILTERVSYKNRNLLIEKYGSAIDIWDIRSRGAFQMNI